MPASNNPRYNLKLILPPPEASDQVDAAQREAAVRQFVTRVGGIQNARHALELWSLLQSAGKDRRKAA